MQRQLPLIAKFRNRVTHTMLNPLKKIARTIQERLTKVAG
jgi:hypothetical protein